MKKLYTLITGSLLLASAVQMSAQCTGSRYHDFIFSQTPDSLMDIKYGYNINFSGQPGSANNPDTLKLDVYQPHGDTDASRALIIFCHGGSFVGGTKNQMAQLCKDFSKMGYVTATISYRLGMTGLPVPGPDSNTAGAAVMRAVHDARAAVRFFRKNAAVGGNTYKIDTNNIYFCGASAGAITAIHLAYMDQLNKIPTYIDTTGTTVGWKRGQLGMHGGVEGLSGNPGYSSKVKAIISLSGAISDTAWMHNGDTPMMATHSVGDGTVPYGRKIISVGGFYSIQYIDGDHVVIERANSVGIINCWKSYAGSTHVPETANIQIYDTTLVMMRNFLEHFTCGVPLDCSYTSFPLTGINELTAADAVINVFPNPAYNEVTVDLAAFKGNDVSIDLYDAIGRKVKNIIKIKAEQYILTRDNLPNGIYFMNVTAKGKLYSKKILFE